MLIPILVFAVLAIVLIFALYKSAETWNWVPIVSIVFIFIAAIFAGITTSKAVKTRFAWMGKDRQNQQLAAQAQSELDTALYGEPNAIEYSPDSLAGINNSLNLLMVGEGRVWCDWRPEVAGETVTLTYTAPSNAVSGRASPANQLQQDMQLFVFANQGAMINDTLVPLPTQFVGTALVQSVNGDAVTVRLLFVTDFSAEEAATPTMTWSLFEKMPGDSPSVFSDDQSIAESAISAFREELRTRHLLAESVGMDPDSKNYEELLDEYTFDGLSMNVIQTWIDGQQGRINDRFDPDDTHKNVMLQFNEASPPFTVDGTGNTVTDGAFDTEGGANDPKLRWGSDVVIGKNKRLLATLEYAVKGFELPDGNTQPPLTESMSVETIVEHYARPLRDYPYLLQELATNTKRVQELLVEAKHDIEVTQGMIDSTSNQIAHREDQIIKLQSDISRQQQQLSAITTHRQNLEQEIGRREQQIRTYYEQILELHHNLHQSGDSQNRNTDRGAPRDPVVVSQR